MKLPFARWLAQPDQGPTPPRAAKIILGIGNPGPEYAHHRHNVGFQCLDVLATDLGARFEEGHRVARLAHATMDGVPVVLAKPKTFVNRSGEAAAALLQRYRLAPQDLIVIYDDLDLPLGRIRVRAKGSSGGHNGLKSLIDHLKTQEFPRIRVGISRPSAWDDRLRGAAREEAIIRWVLSDFTPEEEEAMAAVRQRVAAAVQCVVSEGVVVAMNRFNNDKNFV
ncbi:MAG: aminoacyl-tRNA hydrolase [Chloroflexi bacterium]|nr:aminoacyl-tRNA hydrolase [Chloroflexota bacterium]